jgi:oligosaccharide repeat unit polymerase
MEAPATFDIFNRVVQDNFVLPESGVIRVFFNFIPREIWPGKPLPMQIELAREYNPSGFEAGGGVFAGFYGDAYANAGLVGAILLPFLVGLLLNVAYKKAIYRSSIDGVSIGFYAVLVVFFANAYRGYFSDMTWQVILLYGVFWSLSKINHKLNRIKRR